MIGFPALLLLPALLAGADASTAFRYGNPIQAPRGWVALELPGEVLDACRPGLPDLRIIDAHGVEIPYAIDPPSTDMPRRLPPRELDAELRKDPGERLEATTWIATLPSANLAASAVRIEAADAAYHRRVRVYERVFLRDEADRVLLGEGSILRSRQVEDTIRIRPPTGRVLEIEVERAAGAELQVKGVKVVVEPRRLVFHTEQDANLRLAYGSAAARQPGYDLDSALRHGMPGELRTATVGPRTDSGATPPAIDSAVRGGVLDAARWERRQQLTLPASGTVAWLDLDLPAQEFPSVRIVDDGGRQVPYVVESTPRARSRAVVFQSRREGTQTTLTVGGIRSLPPLSSVVLTASAPPYFQRRVSVLETVEDRRGPTQNRLLGSASWVKAPEEPFSPLELPISAPSADTIEIVVDNGDSAPVEVSSVAAGWTVRRINFLFEAGDRLTLLSGNPSAGTPRYDLVMVAGRLLSSPALPASLQPAVPRTAAAGGVPRWFWGFVVAAAVLVVIALVRTLKSEPGEAKGGN